MNKCCSKSLLLTLTLQRCGILSKSRRNFFGGGILIALPPRQIPTARISNNREMHSGFAALRKKQKKGIPRKEEKKEADKPGKK